MNFSLRRAVVVTALFAGTGLAVTACGNGTDAASSACANLRSAEQAESTDQRSAFLQSALQDASDAGEHDDWKQLFETTARVFAGAQKDNYRSGDFSQYLDEDEPSIDDVCNVPALS